MADEKVFVTRPYTPPIERYLRYVTPSFENHSLTNDGPLLNELTQRLKDKLGIEHLLLTNNGTSALQIAYKVKRLEQKNVLTTPYTYVATCTSLNWEKAHISFGNIDEQTWNVSVESISEKLSSKKIDCIVPVNLFGTPCDLEAIDSVAKDYKTPVIYDSAHALFSKYKSKSIFKYGDIHCVSLHATKLFHTCEGGLLTFKDSNEYELARELINFGITREQNVYTPGINAKMSELHAAMGLAVLDDIDFIIEEREHITSLYKESLTGFVEFQQTDYDCYAQPIYMPIKLESLERVLEVERLLNKQNIYPRKYFMPQHLKFIDKAEQISEIQQCQSIAETVLCLPLMNGMSLDTVNKIIQTVKGAV